MPSEFVLYGGTALALHLGHRQSLDFDFFGNSLFDPARLTAKIPFLTGATITQQEPNTLSAIIDREGPVKVSFFGLLGIGRMRAPAYRPGQWFADRLTTRPGRDQGRRCTGARRGQGLLRP